MITVIIRRCVRGDSYAWKALRQHYDKTLIQFLDEAPGLFVEDLEDVWKELQDDVVYKGHAGEVKLYKKLQYWLLSISDRYKLKL